MRQDDRRPPATPDRLPAPPTSHAVAERHAPHGVLRRVLYVSESGVGRAEVRRIIEAAASHNARHGVTGALVRSDHCFAQLLEGPAAEVEALMARIEADRRHDHVRRLVDEPIVRRAFADWAMAMLELVEADGLLQALAQDGEVDDRRARLLMEAMLAARGQPSLRTRR